MDKRHCHIARPTWKPGDSVLYCGQDDEDPSAIVIPYPPVNCNLSGYDLCEGCLDAYRPWTDAPKRNLRQNSPAGLTIHIERIGAGPYDVLCGTALPGSVITQFPEYSGPFIAYVCIVCQARYEREAQYSRWRQALTSAVGAA